MKLSFEKMHGAGNDFILVDDRAISFPLENRALIARFASRPDGIGSEGVIFVRPSVRADFAMRFFNPDGSEAELCGNGARCVAAFAFETGVVSSRTMHFETRAGDVRAEVLGDGRVKIALPDPRDLRPNFVNSGVPHAIVPVDDLVHAPVEAEGRRIRYSSAFAPAGTNVDFVKWTGPKSLAIRTYERGVEAETFACGTGSVASALVGVAQYQLQFPVTVTTARGYELVVDGRWERQRFSSITLTGPVQRVFSGVIELED